MAFELRPEHLAELDAMSEEDQALRYAADASLVEDKRLLLELLNERRDTCQTGSEEAHCERLIDREQTALEYHMAWADELGHRLAQARDAQRKQRERVLLMTQGAYDALTLAMTHAVAAGWTDEADALACQREMLEYDPFWDC